jgi:hypothetical protein
MKTFLALQLFLFSSLHARAADPSVIAKYGNWYKGDDDLYAQCLILSDGKHAVREYVFQGMQAISVSRKNVSPGDLRKLENLRRPLPSDSLLAPYNGYNFLQIDESAGPDFEVLGQAPGVKGDAGYDQYFSVSPKSDVAGILRTICAMESAD